MTEEQPDLRFAGVVVPAPEFAADDGTPDPDLADVIAAHAAGAAGQRAVVAALAGRRLMIPLVAVLDEVEETVDGLRQEKSSHMATVSIVTPAGHRGLLAFTSVAAMAQWDPVARGIPATAQRVAAAAVEDGADAVLLDLAGPSRVVVQGAALLALAQDRPWPEAYDDPEVHTAVANAVVDVAGLAAVEIVPGPAHSGLPGADLVILIATAVDTDAHRVAADVAARLSADPVVALSCARGIDVGMLPVGQN